MKGFFNQVVDRSKQVATNVASNVQHLVEQNALGTPAGRHTGGLIAIMLMLEASEKQFLITFLMGVEHAGAGSPDKGQQQHDQPADGVSCKGAVL